MSGLNGQGAGYREFLSQKASVAKLEGIEVSDAEIHPILKPHQRAIVRWAAAGGRRAIFANFGLGKSVMQLELLRLLVQKMGGGRALIVVPLGIRQEFTRDATMIDQTITFIRRIEEADQDGLYMTNYETVRDAKLDPTGFQVVSLDEASILRGFGGTLTFREFMRRYEGTARYRFVATATPSPNNYIELLAYAAFLGIMDISEAKTRFFKRDSTKADTLTLLPNRERDFWLFVSSWAILLQRPSDLGAEYSDEGYALPPLDIRWHRLPTDHTQHQFARDDQGLLFRSSSIGVTQAAQEKRLSLTPRVAKMKELLDEDPGSHCLLWHDLEAERHAVMDAIPDAVDVFGAQDLDERERRVIAFSDGEIKYLATKPVLSGAGCNFQRHCHRAIFLGIGFKFYDVIQAIHRIHRFLQDQPVRIDLIYTEAEDEIRKQLERKWQQHNTLVATMRGIIQEYGLAQSALASALTRTSYVARRESIGEQYRLVNNDAVDECSQMPSDSVHLILTSVPFSTQYEYTTCQSDFGHNENNEQFWRQMDFLTPHLLRVLTPGRICAIHVKDRITPGGLTGLGFQTLHPFHCEAIYHYQRHGFAFLGMKTIVTDVVRENNQTYRLGWTEQCKDGTRMGCGVPEYLLIFRKPPTDSSNGYADIPVVKGKPLTEQPDGVVIDYEYDAGKIVPDSGYSRARWQLDAHGFSRSNGNRLLTDDELLSLPHAEIYKRWREESQQSIYDIDRHVRVGELMEREKRLPSTFMLLPPHSWHPDVWTNITRMRTLNMMQAQKGRQLHICPLQFDIADRAIRQYTMPGESVLDPFAGLGTVPMRAVLAGRYGVGVELSPEYFEESVRYVEAAAQQRGIPTLFEAVAAAEDTAEERVEAT